MTSGMNPQALVPIGKSLLTAGFGVTLIRAMRGHLDLQQCFERLIVGFLALNFAASAATTLDGLSHELSEMIRHLGDPDDLRQLLLEAFKKAADAPDSSGNSTVANVPAILMQAWRTGVWGVLSAIVDWVFLVASFLLECAHQVLWQLLLFLLPLAAGAFPLFPRILTNLSLYAVELSLWFPILALVEIATSLVARKEMMRPDGIGLYLVACELIAILLMIMVPSITHRFLHGAFSGDLDSGSGLIRWGKAAAIAAKAVL